MFDLFREVVQTLSNNKLRTFLTGIAVAWGIFMLIVLLGMARGVVNSFESNNWAKTSNRISVYQGVTSLPYKGYSEGRVIKPDMEDMDILIQNHPESIKDVSSYIYLPTTIFSTSKDYVAESPLGVFPIKGQIDGINLIHGRFINDFDIREKRKSVVFEEKAAKSLFGDAKSAIGKNVDALGLSWLVVGVYSHDWRDDIYIPFSTAKYLTGNDRHINNLEIEIKNVSSEDDGAIAEGEIRETLSRQHNYSPDDKSGLYFSNRFLDYVRNKTAFDILKMSVWVIGILTLLSGIIGVSNIMFVSVRERTHEIGIRRAIGAKPRSILLHIIMESVSITALFGYIGIFLGMCITQIISLATAETDFLKNPTVSLQIAIEVTGVLIIAGILAGLFPALKAIKVKPVEALRDE